MATSFKLVLRTSKARKDGTSPVWLRVTADRVTRFISTGLYLEPKDWNPAKQHVRKSHPNYAALNDQLRVLTMEAQTHALGGDSAQAIKQRLQGANDTFAVYFERFIEALRRKDAYWERKKYAVTLGKLRGCYGSNLGWKLDLERFEHYLRTECGNNPNTRRKELQRVRRVIRQAVRDGILRVDQDPFLKYDLPKGQQPERRKLTRDEITALEALSLDDRSALSLARDAFVFAFYAGGMRFGDVCQVKREGIIEDDRGRYRLAYRMMKTGHMMDLPLPDPAVAIVTHWSSTSPYIFPFLPAAFAVGTASSVGIRRRISSRNVIVNRNLKEVADLAGLPRPDTVTFHIARHSFADYARRKGGNLYAVSKTLGHANLQITEQYLNGFDRDAVDSLADELWTTEQRPL